MLRDASKNLFDRYVTYHDINPKTGKDRSFHCRWVDKIGYEAKSGIVFLRFTQDIVPLITRLEENFTKYELEQVSQLTSSYAIRLYELLIQWRSAGKTPIFDLALFRQQLGVEAHQYKPMSNFKTYVKTKSPYDFFLKMTDPQRHLFANKLAELPEMGSYSQGTESYPQFAVRLAEMLKDAQKFEELFPYLQKVGLQAV